MRQSGMFVDIYVCMCVREKSETGETKNDDGVEQNRVECSTAQYSNVPDAGCPSDELAASVSPLYGCMECNISVTNRSTSPNILEE